MKRGLSLVLVVWAFEASATPYTYHSYESMVLDLEQLEQEHPGLAELWTAQERFGLPYVSNGSQSLSHFVLRITNESAGLDKPEVLLVGTQHGDEVLGMEACLALARLLLERYGQDPWITFLVDQREIYLIPLANPWGFVNHSRYGPGEESTSEDMNRDHPYDRCSSFCSDFQALSTVGAQAIYELARRHLFRVVVDFHGGVQMVLHPWGSPIHPRPNDSSPDQVALSSLGQRFRSFGGPYSGYWPVGTANDLLGPASGPLDDSSYATGWDGSHADPFYNSLFLRALSYTIEISSAKTPGQSTLGGDGDPLTPGGSEDGYIPKSLRAGLAAIDIAEPAVIWLNRTSIPSAVGVGESVQVDWELRGCFQIDETRLRYGTQADLLSDFLGQSELQQATTGDPCFAEPRTFSATASFSEPGIYYLAPIAKVDQSLLIPSNPNPPGLAPQSWLVRSRTEDGLILENLTDPNEPDSIQGSIYRSAEPVAISVLVDRPTATPTPPVQPTATPTPRASSTPATPVHPGPLLAILAAALLSRGFFGSRRNALRNAAPQGHSSERRSRRWRG